MLLHFIYTITEPPVFEISKNFLMEETIVFVDLTWRDTLMGCSEVNFYYQPDGGEKTLLSRSVQRPTSVFYIRLPHCTSYYNITMSVSQNGTEWESDPVTILVGGNHLVSLPDHTLCRK